MELKWLEDFMSLAETRSFSRSATLRNVTQPAFSRRIQSLETWLGVDLIDRTSYPTRLTAAGEIFYEQALDIVRRINGSRILLRGQHAVSDDVIEFALPHTLSLTFFPKWLAEVEAIFGKLNTRLLAANVHDAVSNLVDGTCDLLLCYHHPQQPVQLDLQHYDMLVLGKEKLQPYSRCDKSGAPQYTLPGRKNAALPFLAYTPNAYLGGMVDLILREAVPPLHLRPCYQTDMAEGLKAMAMEGHGIAFLPESSVVRELRARQLALAGAHWYIEMEIRLYRARAVTADHAAGKLLQKIWVYLEQNHPNPLRK